MLSPKAGKPSDICCKFGVSIGFRYGGRSRVFLSLILAGLVVLAFSVGTFAQELSDDEGYDISRRGPDPLDQINEALHRYGRIFLWVGAALAGVAILKIISPFRIYYNASDRMLKRAVRGVDELLKRIQKEAEETTNSEPPEESAEGGILAGMAEMAEFTQAEGVPPYVMTVNDRMLDNIRITLQRLRRFQDGHAERYRNYMFLVLKGIKTITEESISAGVPSSLAVDVEEYFRDERRYKVWQKLLSRMRAGGGNQEVAHSFLLFMRNLKEGRPPVAPVAVGSDTGDLVSNAQAPAIPESLNEETLPILQQAAKGEVKNLIAFVQTGTPLDQACSWQFELVRRQQQLHQRDEAQRMLVVFLACERKAWPQITRSKMLPCRTWSHVLHVLGVEETPMLQRRVENRLLGTQEIIVLEKAFLQTFAKRHSLEHVYGHGEKAELMLEMHIPQVRRESLLLLRQLHETEPDRFDRATQALNEAETPQHNEARRLVEHYVNRRHNPPGIEK